MLVAYHETTGQPLTTIYLPNTERLIDSRHALIEKETTTQRGTSASVDREKGYMVAEEEFRIRFNNGEVIDFCADTSEEKKRWLEILHQVTGRGDDSAEKDAVNPRSQAKWCELVLRREKKLRYHLEARS